MFGTFQEELDDVPPQYGVLKPAETWNPIVINFQHVWRLVQDAWRTRNWWDKLRIWFMPTGWRPSDVAEKYPISKIEDVYNFKKYHPEASNALKAYSIFQLLFSTGLMLFMFYNYTEIGFNNLLLYGAFVFAGIYGYTTLMDRRTYALWIEVFRGVFGLAFIFSRGDWFGINAYAKWGSLLVGLYFLITISGGLYFTLKEKRRQPQMVNI
jgi:drug/metabolite transporter (DMT)-like permease